METFHTICMATGEPCYQFKDCKTCWCSPAEREQDNLDFYYNHPEGVTLDEE